MLARPGEGVVPEQEDQVQAPEAGGGGTRQPAEEEGKPPHQQMAHGHQAARLRGHRRHLGGLKAPNDDDAAASEDQHYLLCNIIKYN